ncbi:amidophosphoribosyltransferase [Lactarius hengduanensis]|nr:amidophosphoribosyltransferase [Lactarius hengduanensis]
MCGILGLFLHDPSVNAAPEICEGLSLLQHRGQDACGIVTCGPRGRLYQCKANGMVRDVFTQEAVARLIGGMGIGHVRYPTAGTSNHAEAQPFYVNSPYGITFAHNGNLINTAALLHFMDAVAHRHINTSSDSELLLNIFADHLNETGKFRINEEDIFVAVRGLMVQARGAYACVAMLAGFGIIAFRDPNGIRPLGVARRPMPGGATDWLCASESAAADVGGFVDWEDVRPGEAVILTRCGVSRRQVVPAATFAPDIFEYVYLARPDSVLDGISVYRSRMAMGNALAQEVQRASGLPYREGFVKNRYVGRTFIMPEQQMRKKSVRRKLNAMALEFAGKNVLIVDDSIVRGTTSREIIQMAKDVGSKKVIMASCAPPIRYPNLVAHGRTTEEVAEAIGADLVIFQTLPDLVTSVRQLNPSIERFECSVFDGDYVTGGVDAAYLDHLEGVRSENMKTKAAVVNGLASAQAAAVVAVGGAGAAAGASGASSASGGSDGTGTPSSHRHTDGVDDTIGLHNTWKLS